MSLLLNNSDNSDVVIGEEFFLSTLKQFKIYKKFIIHIYIFIFTNISS